MLALEKSRRVASIIAGVVALAAITIALSIILTKQAPPSRESFISKLPYYQKEFTIVYSQKKDQIYVNILSQPYQENRAKADEWIRSQNIEPKSLNIEYAPSSAFNNNRQ